MIRISLAKYVALVLLVLTGPTGHSQAGAEFDRKAIHEGRLLPNNITGMDRVFGSVNSSPIVLLDFSDLQISNSVAPATFEQDRADLISLNDTAWLVVWHDERQGSKKIFGQVLDLSGSPIGTNLLLVGSDNGADYVDPIAKVDTLKRVYLFYRDQSNGLIFGSRFHSNLTVDLPPFLINDTSQSSYAGPFEAAVYPDGRMVIVWENYSYAGSTIYMRIYSGSGTSLLAPTVVNTDGGGTQHWEPSVAVKPGGGFLVVWEDYRNGRADIYGRLFSGSGAAVGGAILAVPPPDNAAAQFAPKVVYSTVHGFVIGWIDQRQGQEAYIQRYSTTTGLIGSNFRVSGPDVSVINWNLFMTTRADGTLAMGWASFAASNNIKIVGIPSGFTRDRVPIQINSGLSGQRWGGKAAKGVANHVGLVWTELGSSDPDIVFADLDGGLDAVGSEEIINDDMVGAVSTDPFLVTSSNWWNVVTWVDKRNGDGDIYARAVAHDGTLMGNEIRLNQDPFSSLQAEPSLAGHDSGVLAVWVDGRGVNGISGQRIFGRKLDNRGTPAGAEFLISDPQAVAVKGEPKIALNADGSGLVVWLDKRSGSAQVYGHWLNAGSALGGSDFAISSEPTNLRAAYLDIGLDSNGNYEIVWLDYFQSSPTVRGIRYHADRSAGSSLAWMSAVSNVDVSELSSAVGSDGSIKLLWTGSDAADTRVYLTVLDSLGVELQTSFEVTDGAALGAREPSLSVCENGYVSTTWLDWRTGKQEVYYQLFTDGLAMIGNNTSVSQAHPEFMTAPSTHAHGGRAWFVWSDPRADGLTIYASNYLYLPTEVDDDQPEGLPASFRLAQNYPNPFNPSTTIRFELAHSGQINLTVFNLLGQKGITLVEGVYPAGEHLVEWYGGDAGGSGVASGVYFYRLTTSEGSEQRKMLLLK